MTKFNFHSSAQCPVYFSGTIHTYTTHASHISIDKTTNTYIGHNIVRLMVIGHTCEMQRNCLCRAMDGACNETIGYAWQIMAKLSIFDQPMFWFSSLYYRVCHKNINFAIYCIHGRRNEFTSRHSVAIGQCDCWTQTIHVQCECVDPSCPPRFPYERWQSNRNKYINNVQAQWRIIIAL